MQKILGKDVVDNKKSNPFSLLRKPIEMVTLSDSRTSHSDKI